MAAEEEGKENENQYGSDDSQKDISIHFIHDRLGILHPGKANLIDPVVRRNTHATKICVLFTACTLCTSSELAGADKKDDPQKIVEKVAIFFDKLEAASMEMTLQKRYLNVPVKRGEKGRRMTITIDGKLLGEFSIALGEEEPAWWALFDVDRFKGKKLEIKMDPAPKDMGIITQDDVIKGGENMYKEKYRPQFHFSSKRGWLNDPNAPRWTTYSTAEESSPLPTNAHGTNWLVNSITAAFAAVSGNQTVLSISSANGREANETFGDLQTGMSADIDITGFSHTVLGVELARPWAERGRTGLSFEHVRRSRNQSLWGLRRPGGWLRAAGSLLWPSLRHNRPALRGQDLLLLPFDQLREQRLMAHRGIEATPLLGH